MRKTWYTLTEAAAYLTQSTEGGPVTVSDVLQLGIEREITVSLKVTQKGEHETPGGFLVPNAELTEQQLSDIRIAPEESELSPYLIVIDDTLFGITDIEPHPVYVGLYDIYSNVEGQSLLNRLWHDSKANSRPDIDTLNPWILESPDFSETIIRLVSYENRFVFGVRTRAIPECSYLAIKQSELSKLLLEHDTNAHTDRQDYPPDLDALVTAWRKWWKNADRHDRSTHPKKPAVKNWLIEQGLSDKTADAGATIITPDWKK
jgi:hypothetical protein